MSLNANALITLADLKTWLGITSVDAARDSRLEMYINTISTAIETYCNRKFKSATYTSEKYQATDEQELILKNYPVTSITSLTYNDDTLTEADEDFELDEDTGILFREEGWAKTGYGNYLSGKIDFPERNITVTYVAGYSTIPEDLKMVCYEACSNLYDLKAAGAGGISSKHVADVSVTFRESSKGSRYFDVDHIAILNSYKRRNF